MTSAPYIREARMMLGWSGETLCERANIEGGILVRAESVDSTPSITLHQASLIQRAFERAGVRFGINGGVVMMAGKEEA